MPGLNIVPIAEWIKRTDLITRRLAIKYVDDAYIAYYNTTVNSGNKTNNSVQKTNLHNALSQYLKEKGGFWAKVDRNKKSGGLMEFVHNFTKPRGDVLSRNIPSTRHGVLYLWANTNVETQWTKVVIEGVFSVGGKATSMAGSSGLNLVSAGAQATGNTVASVGAGLGGVITGAVRGIATARPASPLHPSPPSPPILPQILRHTQDVMRSTRAFMENPFSHTMDYINNPYFEANPINHLVSLTNRVQNALKEMMEFIKAKLTIIFSTGAIIGAVTKLLEIGVGMVAKAVCAAAAPFVGPAIDIGRGIAQTIAGIQAGIQARFARQKFSITPGHPALIAGALESQINWDIGKGLYNTCKGAGKLAGNILSAGASTLIDLIAAGVEFLVRLATRAYEAWQMKAWIDLVRGAYNKEKTPWMEDPVGDQKVARPRICYDNTKFTALFERGCRASVCVPMMSLNSGICGDQMAFMKMFDDAGNEITQDSFDTATEYFTRLKAMGRQYVRSTGFQFTSQKNDVQGYLFHAIKHHQTPLTAGGQVEKFLTG